MIVDSQCMLALGELAHFIPCVSVCFDMCECLMQTSSGKSCSLKAFDELSSMPSTLHVLSHLILTETHELGTIFISILQLKPQLGELESSAQD